MNTGAQGCSTKPTIKVKLTLRYRFENKELKDALKVAEEQREVEKEIDKVRAEVDRQDQNIKVKTIFLKYCMTLHCTL